MQRVLVVLAFLVLVGLLGVDIYVRVKPPKWASAPTPCPSPSPTAAITPTASPWPGPPGATPAATPGEIVVAPSPAAQPTPPAVAEPRVAPDTAPRPKSSAVPKKPKPSKPTAAASPSPAAPAADAKRGFVTGETTVTRGETRVEGKESGSAEVPAGFDPGGVAVKLAPKFAARVEFDVQPRALKAGDPYVVKVFLRNDGKKSIRVRELRLASSLNGGRSESALTPKMKDVPAQQVALLAEVPSVWKDGVKSWSMEVSVRSGHGDVYTNTVTWR